jgi:hypothetical protein
MRAKFARIQVRENVYRQEKTCVGVILSSNNKKNEYSRLMTNAHGYFPSSMILKKCMQWVYNNHATQFRLLAHIWIRIAYWEFKKMT